MLTESEFNERNKEFEAHKDTLPKEPSGDVKKEYIVGCENASDWKYIHEVLMQDGTLEDNIPNRSCETVDDCPHSATRGAYLLDSSEVEELKKHNKVFYVHLNHKNYPGTYGSSGIEDIDSSPAEPTSKIARYSSTIESQRDPWPAGGAGSILKNPAQSSMLYTDGFHLTRHMQKDDPWYGSSNTTVINSTIEQYGTGKDVDVIVCDTDSWFGHIEFQNNLGGPSNYVGGNVLPGNGTCDVLDVVLESPYYIDPDFFNADSASRLTTRWDGTTVPVESVAIDWWRNNNTSNRSSKFVSPSNGGTATGNNDFGTLSGISNSYTRARNNGTWQSRNSGSGSHGTPCMSEAYGRTLGWAYNANKWFIAIMGTYSIDYETYFDLLKIFHQIKPINPTYNTQDPTISSNSWSKRDYKSNVYGSAPFYYYFHVGTTGSNGVSASSEPAFMAYQNRIAGEYLESHATVVAAREMADSGVIFVAAAGNAYMKQVQSDHADFDNYIDKNSLVPLSNATTTNSSGNTMPNATWYNTTNRRGFPQQAGVDRTTTPHTYPVISVGCLDHQYDSSGKERKVGYSNMGNGVDVFTAGDGALAASHTSGGTLRWDAYYDSSGNVSNTSISGGSLQSSNKYFNGTSSACPIFAGLLATKVQYNRSWNHTNIRNWIQSLGQVNSSEFYYGPSEGTTATDSNWSDTNGLHGAAAYVAYDARSTTATDNRLKVYATNGLTFSGTFTIT